VIELLVLTLLLAVPLLLFVGFRSRAADLHTTVRFRPTGPTTWTHEVRLARRPRWTTRSRHGRGGSRFAGQAIPNPHARCLVCDLPASECRGHE
jgi:hypothetical protein